MTENEFITFHHQCTFPPQRLATPTVTFSSHHELLFMSTITISESQLHTLCRSIKQWAVQYLCISRMFVHICSVLAHRTKQKHSGDPVCMLEGATMPELWDIVIIGPEQRVSWAVGEADFEYVCRECR